MANKNVYELYIHMDGEGGGNQTVAGESASDTAKKSAKQGAGILTAYQIAQPYINATKQVIANNVKADYSNSELSARVNLQMEIASFGLKTAVGIASGMSLAQALGFGTGAGAIIGFVTAVGSTLTNIAVKQNEINNQTKIENEQINILRGRAGIQFNRSRSGE